MVGHPELRDLADCVLSWNGAEYTCHTHILSLRSNLLAHLISIERSTEGASQGSELLRIALPDVDLPSFVRGATPETASAFLRHLYGVDDAPSAASFEEAAALAALADFFGCPALVRTLEAWLAHAAAEHLQRPTLTSVDELCAMFELAMERQLTRLAALLLPWVLQRLNRGPLADGSCPVWKEVQARLTRLAAAMPPTVRALSLDMQWWACAIPQRCATCGCRNGDMAMIIHPSYLASLGSVSYAAAAVGVPALAPPPLPNCVAVSRLPESYLSVCAHMAHVLVEGHWGLTPPTSAAGSLRPQ